MKKDISQAKNPDLIGSMAAMKRAAARAREVAIQTNTHLVVQRDGQLVYLSAQELLKEKQDSQD